jgi:serine/threonine-protein kinase
MGVQRFRLPGRVPLSFSPDGKFLAFMDLDPANGDARILSIVDHKIQPLLQTPFRTTNPRFSPDGRWVAFESARSGHSEVYVRPYPGPGGEWQISVEGGTEAVWNPNGRELFYRDGEKMMAVEIVTQPDFSVSKPQMLFERAYASLNVGVPNYDVSPDGQRFLMIKDIDEEENAPARQVNVILNFTEELKRRLPGGAK